MLHMETDLKSASPVTGDRSMAHVIVVDDEPLVLQTLATALRRAGHRVSAWTRLSAALEAAIWSQPDLRSEEHTSELQSLMRISYAVFCLKKQPLILSQYSHLR